MLAFPAPAKDSQTIAKCSPVTRCAPAAAGVEQALDGNPETALAFPAGAGQGNSAFTIDFEVGEPFTARSLALTPGKAGWAGRCEVLAAGEDGQFKTVKQFKFDRSNMEINVGFLPRGPVVAAFPRDDREKIPAGIHACGRPGGVGGDRAVGKPRAWSR